MDLRPITHRLTTRKSLKYSLNEAKHRFFYMIITQKSFIFNDKLNVPFTHYDRYMTDIVNICKSVSMLFCLLSERYIIK